MLKPGEMFTRGMWEQKGLMTEKNSRFTPILVPKPKAYAHWVEWHIKLLDYFSHVFVRHAV